MAVDAMVVRILPVACILIALVMSGCTSPFTSDQDRKDSESDPNDPVPIDFIVTPNATGPGGTLTVSRIGVVVDYQELRFVGAASCAVGTGYVGVGDKLTCIANGGIQLVHIDSATIVWVGEMQGAEGAPTQSETSSTAPSPSGQTANEPPGCLKTWSLHGTIVTHDEDKKTYDMRNDVAGPYEGKMLRVYWDSASSPHKQNSSGCMTAGNSLFVEPHESFLDAWRMGSEQPGHDYTGIDMIVYAESHAVYRVDEPYS